MARGSLLLVDDDEISSQILGYILVDEDYAVDAAATGGAALDKVKTNDYDLVFLDYMLPDMRGHEVAKRMRGLKPGIKIILLTGYTRDEDTPEDLFEKILLKPVPPDIIVKAIKDILG